MAHVAHPQRLVASIILERVRRVLLEPAGEHELVWRAAAADHPAAAAAVVLAPQHPKGRVAEHASVGFRVRDPPRNGIIITTFHFFICSPLSYSSSGRLFSSYNPPSSSFVSSVDISLMSLKFLILLIFSLLAYTTAVLSL